MSKQETDFHLRVLANDLITEVTSMTPTVREGVVMTVGPVPYRRLDCDGRALAYIRARPRKRVVRVDVSGLWHTPRTCRLKIPNAGGAATLMLRSTIDKTEAVRFLQETIERTRTTQLRLRLSALPADGAEASSVRGEAPDWGRQDPEREG